MKITAERVSQWSGILAIPGVIAWYVTQLDFVRPYLKGAEPLVPQVLLGLAVLAIVTAMAANARVHRSRTAHAEIGKIPADPGVPKIEEVVNQTFKNQEVLLDDHAYFACTFENCSFVYNFGATGGFGPGCRFAGSRGIKSSDPRLQHLLQFLGSLGLLNPWIKPLYTPRQSALVSEGSIEDEAQREIHLVLNDRQNAYWNANDPRHGEAVERMRMLYAIAYPRDKAPSGQPDAGAQQNATPSVVASRLTDRIGVTLEYSFNQVRLQVANQGPNAEFYGVFKIQGMVSTDRTSRLFCKWSHANGPRAKLARGETGEILLAELKWDTRVTTARWEIYEAADSGSKSIAAIYSSMTAADPSVFPDIVLSGQIYADPELASGPQSFRVILKAFGAELQ